MENDIPNPPLTEVELEIFYGLWDIFYQHDYEGE
jgi:hypothetical protein